MAYYSSGAFSGLLSYLDTFGVTDIILPFILIFTIIFAVLQKINLFGGDGKSKKFNVIIAIGIALLSVIPHATGRYQQFDIVDVINNSLPQIGLILIGLVLLMVLVGLIGGKTDHSGWLLGGAGILAVVLLIMVFWRALYPYSAPTWLSFIDDPSFQALFVIILVFGLIVWFVTKEPKKPTDPDFSDSAKKFFKGMFGGQ
ncbi:MAG TPA: hypothetical protein VLJ21_03865 [Candidatus Binatia bacterium]|nr:hypothetical protein [Candidatus Binatia bacterium]